MRRAGGEADFARDERHRTQCAVGLEVALRLLRLFLVEGTVVVVMVRFPVQVQHRVRQPARQMADQSLARPGNGLEGHRDRQQQEDYGSAHARRLSQAQGSERNRIGL